MLSATGVGRGIMSGQRGGRHLPECQLAPREGSIGSVLGGGKQGEASGRALTVLALHHSSAATHDPSLLQPACLQAWAPAAPVCRDTPPLAGGVPPPPGVTAGGRSCAAASRARTAGVCVAAVSSLATFWNSTRLSPSAVMPAGGRGGRASGRRHAWHRRGAQCRVATPRRAGNCQGIQGAAQGHSWEAPTSGKLAASQHATQEFVPSPRTPRLSPDSSLEPHRRAQSPGWHQTCCRRGSLGRRSARGSLWPPPQRSTRTAA